MANNVNLTSAKQFQVAVTATAANNKAVLGYGSIPGVALNNRDADGTVLMVRYCIAKLPVHGHNGTSDTAITAGDKLYLSVDGADLNVKATDTFYGIAAEAVALGDVSTIQVVVN